MRLNTILHRSIFMEMFPPFAASMFFLTFVLLTRRILELTNIVVNYQAGLFPIFMLMLYSLPFLLTFAIPMSVMMAVLLTFLRLSGDNEMAALKSSGVSPHHFLVPVGLFCIMGWLLSSLIISWMMPRANLSFRNLAANLAQSHIDAAIKERTFIDSFDGVMLYVSQVDLKNKTLEDIFIEDRRTPHLSNIIVAPRGQITSDPQSFKIRFKLFDGVINRADLANQAANVINFKTYEVNLDAKKLKPQDNSASKYYNYMTFFELKRFLKTVKNKDKIYYKALMKYHEKMTLPAACLALGLVALPLGLQAKTEKRSMGIVMGIVLFVLYYLVLSVGWALGESGTLPPIVGLWSPNILMAVTGIYLYARAVKDLPLLPEKLPVILNRCNPFNRDRQCKMPD